MSGPQVRIRNPWPRCAGLGLLELMLAVALVALLAAIAVPSYNGYKQRMAIVTAIGDIRRIEQMLSRYEMQSPQRNLPASLAEAGINLRDPWGNPYQYLSASDSTIGEMRKDRGLVPVNTDYDLYSMGPDALSVSPLTSSLSRDDIVRAGNGAFVGSTSDYVP